MLKNSLADLPPITKPPLRPIPRTVSEPQTKKRRVLVWSDAATATTGFGVVSKHILKALHNTGKYEIDQLAINMFVDFPDKDEFPYNMQAARLGNPKDPYGNQMFLDNLMRKPYDLVFVINDTFVAEGVSGKINEAHNAKQTQGKPDFKLIYYYPVDCRFMPRATGMVKVCDMPVAYTQFAKESTQKLLPKVNPQVIYHGSDIQNFKPVAEVDRNFARKRFLGVDDPDKFVVVNVNRNNVRKDIARTILAFKEFRKKVPNSLLYIHTKIVDSPGHGQEIDLSVCVEELGLSMKTDVIFPQQLHPARGFPIDVLNLLMNCGDAFLTTTLGEGWGLTITEAMAAGVPVIVPNNTSLPEIVGSDGDKGYMYPCREQVYADNSGYRYQGRTEDIVAAMMRCYTDWKEKKPRRQDIIQRAAAFVHQNSWENICKQWVELFEHVANQPSLRRGTGGEIL
jgi:glycosyltransferase involved in cell wall biosynthesis